MTFRPMKPETRARRRREQMIERRNRRADLLRRTRQHVRAENNPLGFWTTYLPEIVADHKFDPLPKPEAAS